MSGQAHTPAISFASSKNREVAAKAEIHKRLSRIVGHQVQERVRGIIHMQKFAPRDAITPNYQFGSAYDLGFMSLA